MWLRTEYGRLYNWRKSHDIRVMYLHHLSTIMKYVVCSIVLGRLMSPAWSVEVAHLQRVSSWPFIRSDPAIFSQSFEQWASFFVKRLHNECVHENSLQLLRDGNEFVLTLFRTMPELAAQPSTANLFLMASASYISGQMLFEVKTEMC